MKYDIMLNYRATVIATQKLHTKKTVTDVFTIERKAKDFNSFLAIVSTEYGDCDELIITDIEIFDRAQYTVKYIHGERVL